jgi:hypothetical protein
VRFYVGLHQPSDAKHFERACISINRFHGHRTRRKPVGARLLIDSGAFTELARNGGYRSSPADYAAQLRRLVDEGVAEIDAAVAQDFMCEPFVLAKTGLTVAEHQRLTIQRYDELLAERLPMPVMPVLQGWEPVDYARHALAYGNRLLPGGWTGVGSVCRRNSDPVAVYAVLSAIRLVRPDLRLHGFGLKTTALRHRGVLSLLYSADSMAWSLHQRKNGGNRNDWRNAKIFVDGIVESCCNLTTNDETNICHPYQDGKFVLDEWKSRS